MTLQLFPKWHYFFYGMSTEDVLSGMIQSAEAKGCEFLQVSPMQIPVPTSALVRSNGQPQTVLVYRIFVRCRKEDFPRIQEAMNAEAKKESQEGLRP